MKRPIPPNRQRPASDPTRLARVKPTFYAMMHPLLLKCCRWYYKGNRNDQGKALPFPSCHPVAGKGA